LLYVICPH